MYMYVIIVYYLWSFHDDLFCLEIYTLKSVLLVYSADN